VLDVGCGTGENVIFFSQLGMNAWGIDSAPLAIEKARQKAEARKVKARFEAEDALHLGRLRAKFNTVTDCGLFHVFSDRERLLFTNNLRMVMERDGTYLMLCFSTKEPTDWDGPRRVSEREIRDAFGNGWRINYIKESWFETRFHEEGGHALLSSISIE